jgi:hypothetical protein
MLTKVLTHGALVLAAAVGVTVPAKASVITYQLSGEASATITTGNGTIGISLTDLYVNPTGGVIDDLSALKFTLINLPGAEAITGFTDTEIDISGSGAVTTTGTNVDPGWLLSTASATTTLDVLGGGAGPAHTLIGSTTTGSYPGDTGSVDGNNAHNPFLQQTITWTLSAASVTSATTVTGVTFQFGTTDNSNLINSTPFIQTATPEPATWSALAGGIGLLAALRFRKQRRS